MSVVVSTSLDDLEHNLIDNEGLWPHRRLSSEFIIEQPTAEMLDSVSPVISRYYSKLAAWDFHFQRYAPNLIKMNETTSLGELELGERIRSEIDHTASRIKNRPDLLIKYMHDCMDGPFAVSPHPLAKEIWLQMVASKVNITDAPLFISPAVAISISPISPKIEFQLTPEQFTNCHFAGGTVRYAIFSVPSGRSMRSLMFPPYSSMSMNRFKFVMTFGAKLLVLLKRLHGQGIVHGNLGIDNFLAEEDEKGKKSLKLYGFSFAQPIEKRLILPVKRGTSLYQSPWEMTEADHRYNFRDDIFRALRIVAQLLNPKEYFDRQLGMSARELGRWNMLGNIFTIPGSMDDPINYLPLGNDVKEQIKSQLGNILFYTKFIADPYDIIITAFADLARLAGGLYSTSVSTPSPSL